MDNSVLVKMVIMDDLLQAHFLYTVKANKLHTKVY